MSRENVELVRRGNDAFRRGDWEAFDEIADPHVSLRMDSAPLNTGDDRRGGGESGSAKPNLRLDDTRPH